MKVYKDVFTNDEVCSDSYVQEDPFGVAEFRDIAFEVKSNKRVKGNEDYGIADNSEEAADGMGADVEQVIDIVDSFQLTSTSLSKKEFSVYIKNYMQKILKYLEEKKPDRAEVFKTKAQPFIKHILTNFDDFEFYMGESLDMEAGLTYSYYKGEEITPRFVYISDGLYEEKY
ncbi:translationally-controlled tumor-like protein [Plasmodium brasilianum]|uniref:Translationally-controlled tumor protein homolog, putative n=2 Tax=Plasmodium (Plasmodium) TaxID=418103 RepID=A0A1A8W5I7_PLAMA|nr:histamine-releasing factor, putative [Plasmodium malariae]KAI4839712.1 translationally-controlled tumor-like protein [Plasmodium brasilianum]SBS86417.1 translationally-controlled tumor protein homolog, putative (TCTP) [Plasmodium malariae]SBT86654.1 histamine-releasing factor, putative [Plasmodium malariae]